MTPRRAGVGLTEVLKDMRKEIGAMPAPVSVTVMATSFSSFATATLT